MATGYTTLGVCRLLCCVLILHVCIADGASAAQAPAPVVLGSMQTTGDVSLNGMKAATEQTVYMGDTVRTTAGMAVLSMPGEGTLSITEDSQMFFGGAGSLGTLRYGTAEIRSIQSGKNLVLQFGNWMMYLPSYVAQA